MLKKSFLILMTVAFIGVSSLAYAQNGSYTDLTPGSIYAGDVLVIKVRDFDKSKKVAWRIESNEASKTPFFLPESLWPANSYKHYHDVISPLTPDAGDPSVLTCKIGPIPETVGVFPSMKIGRIYYQPGIDAPNESYVVKVFSRDEVAADELVSESMKFEVTYRACQQAQLIFRDMPIEEHKNIKTVMTKLEDTKDESGKYLVEVFSEYDGGPIPLNPNLKKYFYMALVNVNKCADASLTNSLSDKYNRCGKPEIISSVDEWLKAISINFRYVQLKNHKKYKTQSKNLPGYIIRGLKENSETGIENYRKYVEYVKSLDKKALAAFMPINKAITEKLRVDLGMSMSLNKPGQVIELIKGYYETSRKLDSYISSSLK